MVYKLSGDQLSKLVIRQQYDATAILSNLMNISGTALPGVFQTPMFWLMWLIHVIFFCIVRGAKCERGDDLLKVDPKCFDAKESFNMVPLAFGDLGVLNTLTGFFIVFYSGNCFTRYTTMYGATVAIQGKMHNISLYVRAYFVQPNARWNVIRYLLASHFIFYWSLKRRMFDWKNPQYPQDPGTFKDICHDVLIPKGVLIPIEALALQTYKGNKHKLLFSWSIIALKRIMQAPMPVGEKGNPMLHSEFEQTSLVADLKKEIVEMRGAIGVIDNSMLFPIHFHYYHMVNMTVFVYIVLLSYILAIKDNPLTVVIYPLTLLVVLGLLNTANAMSDPFGSDTCDFNQDMITNGIYNECKMLCEEPDEDFLSSIGNPAFNPKRNPDGSIDTEAAKASSDPEASKKDEEEEAPAAKEVLWSTSDVQAIIDERDSLKEEMRRGGVEDLTEKIKLLVDVNVKGFTALERMNMIPHEIQEANMAAMLRVDKLEHLVTKQLASLVGELRGDAFDTRYVTVPPTDMPQSRAEAEQGSIDGLQAGVAARIVSPRQGGREGLGVGAVFPGKGGKGNL